MVESFLLRYGIKPPLIPPCGVNVTYRTANFNESEVIDMLIETPLNQDEFRLRVHLTKLHSQLAEFEKRYGMSTVTFFERFERGELGDDMDFMEWAATTEMLRNAEKHLSILTGETGDEHT